jgi:hypothetical protein
VAPVLKESNGQIAKEVQSETHRLQTPRKREDSRMNSEGSIVDQRKTRLHDLNGIGTREFDMPRQALKYAHDKQITGYVIDRKALSLS